MNRHEQLMAAARASSIAARSLGLPRDEPQLGIEHDENSHLARLRQAYRLEQESNREMRDAVIHYGKKMQIVTRATFALGMLTLCLVVFVYSLSQRNREAVRVSCTVIKNALLESGAGGAKQTPTSPAARAQAENITILTAAINRELLTSDERKKLSDNARLIEKSGGAISIPNCNEIAAHPERVRELLLNETTVPARRSPAEKTNGR